MYVCWQSISLPNSINIDFEVFKKQLGYHVGYHVRVSVNLAITDIIKKHLDKIFNLQYISNDIVQRCVYFV